MGAIRFNVVILIAAVTIFSTSISAKEFVVGDGNGWTLNFDYQSWADGKEFYVGDTLVFNYPAGKHTVLRVNGTGFQQCDVSSVTGALTSGNDKITLQTPGRKWYICGVGKHCEASNMKLVINVVGRQMTLAPSPLPTSEATTLTCSLFYGFIAAFLGALIMVFV